MREAGLLASKLSESAFIGLKDYQDFCEKAGVSARKFFRDQLREGSKPSWGWSFW